MTTNVKAYYMLYKFLKLHGIFKEYINNVRKSQHLIFDDLNAKEVLIYVVEEFSKYVKLDGFKNDNDLTSYENLFSDYRATFSWGDSKEGIEYWFGFYFKWRKFFELNRKIIEKW